MIWMGAVEKESTLVKEMAESQNKGESQASRRPNKTLLKPKEVSNH